MNRRCSRRDLLRATLGLAAASRLPARSAASDDPESTGECFRRMGLIYEAIRRWQRSHGAHRWPANLAVLRHEGLLTDVRAWICPLAESTLDLSFDPDNARVLSARHHNRESNYNYEFSADPVAPDQLGELPPMDKGAWKSALTATALGHRVPILRCKAHGPETLNIRVDGRTYRSGLYWEYSFPDVRPEPYTMPWLVVHHPGSPGETRLPRPDSLPAACLDLGPAANANPELPWLDGMPQGPSLKTFLSQTHHGADLSPVPFDARRIVQTTGATVSEWKDFVAGLGFLGQAYPRHSRDLLLPEPRPRRLVALQATAFKGKTGEVAGELALSEPGRPPHIVPLIYGKNTGYWRDPDPAPALAVAWRASSPASDEAPDQNPNPAAAAAPNVSTEPKVVFRLTLEIPPTTNPSPGPLSLQLRANPDSAASPFLLGLTAEY